LWHPFSPQIRRGELELTTIDVGQGDSLLVVFPDGRTMLLDGGGIPAFGGQSKTQLDIGEDVVAPYLWERSIRRIDVVALSHAHADHIGGLPALVSDFHPRELWTGATPETAEWCAVRDRATALGPSIVSLREGRKMDYGGAEIEVLAPAVDYVTGDTAKNNDSLVLKVRYGSRAFLLCGDVERAVEQRMLMDAEIHPIDVLKVAHHGSRTSTTAEFLDAASPIFALISVGDQNSYGHPNREVLSRLEERRTGVYRTDLDGLITVRTDGRHLQVETRRDQPSGLTLMPGYGQ
jgi:competence protein ComEC